MDRDSEPCRKNRFNRTIFLLFFCFLFQQITAFTQNVCKADEICGEWWTPDNNGRMIFFQSNGKYYAKVSWLKISNDKYGKPRCEKHNPNSALHPRHLQDLILFSDFIYEPEKGKYTAGKIYDAEDSGNNYSGWLKLIEHNVLEIHGYVGFSLIGKSVFFTRVQK
jgi:uncharacterized protein (DUF2147 family)